MIGFERPQALLAALPWAAFCLWLAWTQWTALRQARDRVDARSLARVTRYSAASLVAHHLALALLGGLLLVSVAEPVRRVRAAAPAGGARVLLVFDASASMAATDVSSAWLPVPPVPPVPPQAPTGDEEPTRFDLARAWGRQLLRELEETSFGVISFSGRPTLNLPMSADRDLVARALAALELHTVYQSTGSSLTSALEAIFHFTTESAADLQVVLFGDGELPYDEDYGEQLASLVELGVRVHAVAIGSPGGQRRVIYDFADVVAGKEQKRALLRYTTRRVDRHYEEIAAATGGRFVIADGPRVEELIADLRAGAVPVAEEPAAADPRIWWLILAAAATVAHLLFLTPPAPAFRSFDVDRLGPSPRPLSRSGGRGRSVAAGLLVLPLLFTSCAQGPRHQAHRANEEALVLDDLGRHEAARRRFERSASHGYRPEIPIHNLARSLARRGDYTEAHELFQRTLELAPDLGDARFNDGVTLYEWGRAERDPRGCQLERTLELWRAAERRFASIVEGVVERDEPAARAARNVERLEEEIARVERLIAEPPAECASPAADPAGGSEGEDGGGGEDGKDGEQGEQGDQGEQGEGQPPPDGGSPPEGAGPASGPLTAAERQEIERQLERIAGQALEPGKFYRRSRLEQHSREDWSRPEAVIWW